MRAYSTRQAAKKLGISLMTLQRYLAAKKIVAPKVRMVGGVRVRLWTDKDVEQTRKVLSKLKNGRRKNEK
jgi:excisionase family DNA binding protein